MNKVEYVLVIIACFVASIAGILMEFAGYFLAISGQPDLALSNAVLGVFIFIGAMAVAMLATIVYNRAAKAAIK